MQKSLVLAAAAAMVGSAAAQAATITLPAVGVYGRETVLGSVVASDKDKTTYSLTCGGARPTPDYCGLGKNFLITVEPSTFRLIQTMYVEGTESSQTTIVTATQTAEIACSSTNSEVLSCTGGYTVQSGSSIVSTTLTETVSGTDLSSVFVPVTLTDKLPGATGTGSSQATATTTPSGTSAGTSGSTGAAGASATSSTPGKNAGPRATQNAVLAGVAAIVGGAALL